MLETNFEKHPTFNVLKLTNFDAVTVELHSTEFLIQGLGVFSAFGAAMKPIF